MCCVSLFAQLRKRQKVCIGQNHVKILYIIWILLLTVASFPGPAQLSVAISTMRKDTKLSTLFRTASDEKLGGAWKRGQLTVHYQLCYAHHIQIEGLNNRSYIYTYIGHARGGDEHSLQFMYYSNYCSEVVVWLLCYILFLDCCVRCAVWTSFVFEVNDIIYV